MNLLFNITFNSLLKTVDITYCKIKLKVYFKLDFTISCEIWASETFFMFFTFPKPPFFGIVERRSKVLKKLHFVTICNIW